MTYFIKTLGCQMNFSDSERIAGFMNSCGFQEVSDIKAANLVIFNTCGVRQTAEDRVYGQVHNIRKDNPPQSPLKIKGGVLAGLETERRGLDGSHPSKKNENQNRQIIVITGCLAHRKDVQRKLKDKVDLFFPIKNLSEFENWLIENLPASPADGLKISNFKFQIPARKNTTIQENISYLSIPPQYAKKDSAFVPVMTGCNNFCSYCVVPYARGREKSRPVEEIFEEVEGLSGKGYEEVTLLGQNVNSYHGTYNMEHGTKLKFPSLLDKLVKSFPGTKFGFLTSHPKDFSKELINIISENENISRKIHLPVQSGSDKVLKDMNRPYTKKHYLSLIEKIRKNIPGAEISTDVIVGFPTETLDDFEETIDVFKKIGYSEAFINKYSPRPETAALELGDPVPWNEKKRREKILRKLL